MNISGIRPYEGFYEYDTIKYKKTDIVKAAETESLVPAQKLQKNDAVREKAAGQTYTSYDYAERYQPDEIYQMKGADSELENLDVAQAISTMKKDQILQQYQFFVGEGLAQEQMSTTGTAARSMEDFSV